MVRMLTYKVSCDTSSLARTMLGHAFCCWRSLESIAFSLPAYSRLRRNLAVWPTFRTEAFMQRSLCTKELLDFPQRIAQTHNRARFDTERLGKKSQRNSKRTEHKSRWSLSPGVLLKTISAMCHLKVFHTSVNRTRSPRMYWRLRWSMSKICCQRVVASDALYFSIW